MNTKRNSKIAIKVLCLAFLAIARLVQGQQMEFYTVLPQVGTYPVLFLSSNDLTANFTTTDGSLAGIHFPASSTSPATDLQIVGPIDSDVIGPNGIVFSGGNSYRSAFVLSESQKQLLLAGQARFVLTQNLSINDPSFHPQVAEGTLLDAPLATPAPVESGNIFYFQTVRYVTPNQPIIYGQAATSQKIDLTGAGDTDFVLLTDGGIASVLSPQAKNSLVVDAAGVVAALNPGDVVGPQASSLNPSDHWLIVSGGHATFSMLADEIDDDLPQGAGNNRRSGDVIVQGRTAHDNAQSVLDNFAGKTAYIGFYFNRDGQKYYGWMEVQNPDAMADGSIVAWASQTIPNTPITIVPAPSLGAQTSFAAVLRSSSAAGTAGSIQFTVNGDRVLFQSTLYQAWTTNATLASVLEVQGNAVPFNLGKGAPGSWPSNQFTGPFPNPAQTPGTAPLFAGLSFAGSFTAFPGLEDALLNSGGAVTLRVKGTAAGVKNPVAAGVLATTAIRLPDQFTVLITNASSVWFPASPWHGQGWLTLNSNLLTYDLALAPGVRTTSAKIVGPNLGHFAPGLIVNLQNAGAMHPYFSSGVLNLTFRGQVRLTIQEISELQHGELQVEFSLPQVPYGQLHGPILPVEPLTPSGR